MLGTLCLFLACICAVSWYLVENAKKSDDTKDRDGDKIPPSKKNGKRRTRASAKRASKKPKGVRSEQQQHMHVESKTSAIRNGERTTSNIAPTSGSTLNTADWPALGGAPGHCSRSPDTQRELIRPAQSEHENLAALHATLLDASRESQVKAANADQTISRAGACSVGDRVEARFEGRDNWFPATIAKTHFGGLVNLAYDDGERENRVHTSLIRKLPSAKTEIEADGDSRADSNSDVGQHDEGRGSLWHGTTDQSSQSGWKVAGPKPKKTLEERQEARAESNTNMKNRVKRQKKKEKLVAAREALRRKL